MSFVAKEANAVPAKIKGAKELSQKGLRDVQVRRLLKNGQCSNNKTDS